MRSLLVFVVGVLLAVTFLSLTKCGGDGKLTCGYFYISQQTGRVYNDVTVQTAEGESEQNYVQVYSCPAQPDTVPENGDDGDRSPAPAKSPPPSEFHRADAGSKQLVDGGTKRHDAGTSPRDGGVRDAGNNDQDNNEDNQSE